MKDNLKLIEDAIKQLQSKNKLTTLQDKKKVPYWIDTGSTLLNSAIGADGYPGGRVIELIGESSTGKSVFCYTALANVQKMGGLGILLDTEAASDFEFAKVFGVDVDKLMYGEVESTEEMHDTVLKLIGDSRKILPLDVPILVCLDSCTPAPQEELDKGFREAPKMGDNAKIHRRALSKLVPLLNAQNVTLIGVNHLMATINTGWAPRGTPDWDSRGGKAWKFYATTRIKLSNPRVKRDKTTKKALGIEITTEVVKNRIGIPFNKAPVIIDYRYGIDDIGGTFTYADSVGVFGTKRGWKEWIATTVKGYKSPCREKELLKLFRDNPSEFAILRQTVKDIYTSSVQEIAGAEEDIESVDEIMEVIDD